MLGTKKRKITVKIMVMATIMSLLFSITVFAVNPDDAEGVRNERALELYNEVLDTAGEYTVELETGQISYKYRYRNTSLDNWHYDSTTIDASTDRNKLNEKLKKEHGATQVERIEEVSSTYSKSGKAVAIENAITRTLVDSDEEAGITAALCNMVQNLCDIEEFTMMASSKISKWFGSGGSEFINLFNGSVVSTIYGACCMIGFLLVLIYFFMDLTEMLESRNISETKIFMLTLRLIVGICFIRSSKVIAEYITGIGIWFFNQFNTGQYSQGNERIASIIRQTYLEYRKNYDLSNGTYIMAGSSAYQADAGGIVKQILDLLNNEWFMTIAMDLAVFKIIIELMFRIALSPITVAELFFDNRRGGAMRSLKQLLSCALTPTLIIIAINILESIKASAAVDSIVTVAAINLTVLTISFTVQPLVNSILGA